MRVADAMLIGDGVAPDDRFAIVDGREGVAIVAHCHEETMRGVVEEREQISPQTFL